jgi:hypothetical protein
MQNDPNPDKDPDHVIEEVRIPAEMYRRLCARAAQLEVTREVFFGYCLLRYIDEVTPRDPPTAP